MRALALALWTLATLGAAGCCNVPCDPCCPPCREVTGRPSLFQNPPPRSATLPGELPADGAPVAPPPEAPGAVEPFPVVPGPLPPPIFPPDSPETLESK